MEYELEERPQMGEAVWYSFSDRSISPQRDRRSVENPRNPVRDRAVRIPDQEPLS